MAKKKNTASVKDARDNRPLIVQQIVVKAPQRRVYDVGDWRAALRSADAGKAKYLYDLFDDIMIDGVLSNAVDKRIQAVLNAEVVFRDARGKESDAVVRLIDTTAWETLVHEIMNRRFYGRAAVELSFRDGFAVEAIKPKYIDLHNHRILLDDSGMTGVSYDGDSHMLVLGRPDDFGLLLKAAPYAIWKRGGFGDYAQWIELFGMPQRIGKYNTYDPASRRLLEEAFEKAGSAPYIVIPKESEIETRDGNTGSGSSYNEFREANNEEMLITILGQTLTTVQGERGARSLGEVHLEVEAAKHASDLRFVQRTLNERVIPMLSARGFAVEGGAFVFPKAAEPLSVADIVQLSNVIDIPAKYIHEKYSIPMPEHGEPVAGRRPATVEEIEVVEDKADAGGAETGKDKDGKKGRRLADGEGGILGRLRDFFAGAPQRGATAGAIPTRMSDDATLDERVMRHAAEGAEFDTELWRFIADDLLKAVRTASERSRNGARAADVSYAYGVRDDAVQTAMEINLFQFSAAKTLAELQELNHIFRESGDFRDFERRAAEVCRQFNREWQRTEYDTALAVAEEASNYCRLVRGIKTMPFWEYMTARDERVRRTHRLLDGVILPADDIRWKKIYPPNGWNCRCTVIGRTRNQAREVDTGQMRRRVDAYFETAEWKKAAAQGWGVNRALRGEVFTQNQFYIRRFQNKASKTLGALYCNDWGIDSFGKRLAAAKTPMPLYEGTADEWYRTHNTLKDYMGREVVMDEKVFRTHTSNKYARARVPLLGCIGDVLSSPDEVWLNDYTDEFKNLNFIKFYEGKVINVICEVTEDLEYRITTWFEIVQNPKLEKKVTPSRRRADPRWKYRRGLLIKKS